MKARWIKIALTVGAVAFLAWFGSHLRFTEQTVPLPLQGEALTNPYYAAIKLTEQLHAKAAWERVFTVPASDSVVLLSNWNWSLSRTRRERIEAWVANGGRLVVDNSLIGGAEDFEKWTGVSQIERRAPEDDDDAGHDSPDGGTPEDGTAADGTTDDGTTDDGTADDGTADTTDTGIPVEADPLDRADDAKKDARERRRTLSRRERNLLDQLITGDCTTLTEDGTNRALSVCGIDESHSLTSTRKLQWALRDEKRIQALRVAVGRGSVTVLNASPFRYREFLQGDHPKLFVTVTQLHPGDDVFFFTEEDHASLLTLTWRHGAPVVLLLAALIVLALWRNVTRFGPMAAVPEKARRSLAEQIRGTGQFTLRFGGGRALHAAMVRALREAAIRRIPGYDRLSSEEAVAALSKLTGVLASDLGPALNYSGARSPHELRNVIAVLETARRRLSLSKMKA